MASGRKREVEVAATTSGLLVIGVWSTAAVITTAAVGKCPSNDFWRTVVVSAGEEAVVGISSINRRSAW